MRVRLLLSDLRACRGSMRLNRVSIVDSPPMPPTLPEPDADADADAEPEADEPMLLVSSVKFRLESKRLRGLAAEAAKLGEATADCGLFTHLPLTGDSNVSPPGLSEIDKACSGSGLPVPSILLAVDDVDARVGVLGPPILDRTLLSYA